MTGVVDRGSHREGEGKGKDLGSRILYVSRIKDKQSVKGRKGANMTVAIVTCVKVYKGVSEMARMGYTEVKRKIPLSQ